jgi:membrane associated rhomboid family serine protease/Zn-finger nucleic acid-binding protein
MIKPVCPHCTTSLVRRSNRHVLQYRCANCHGFMAYFGTLKKALDPKDAQQLWLASEAAPITDLACGFCRNKMRRVFTTARGDLDRTIEIDVCRSCHSTWFDTGEWSELAEASDVLEAKRKALPPEVDTKAYARALAELERKKLEPVEGVREAQPESFWRAAIGYAGIPVEEDADIFVRQPWLTWLLIFSCVWISLLAFKSESLFASLAYHADVRSLRSVVAAFTSFFVHGSLFHLIGNMYFLWVFGDNVEDYLGKRLYALLLALATIFGCALFSALDPNALDVPLVGASGGIFGVITFYVFKFPKRRFVYTTPRMLFVLRRLIAIPAWLLGLMYGLGQLAGAVQQAYGLSRVSYLSHLGGAIIGLAFVWFSRNRERAWKNGIRFS